MKKPKKIYLHKDACVPDNLSNYTWSEDRIDDSDIEYILKSKYEEAPHE